MTEYETLINNLKILELERIQEILPDYLNQISKNPPSLTTSLCKLTNDEINFKNERASEGIIKSAGFPFRKSLDSFDFSFQPSISKNQIIDLATLRFLDENENIIFVGNPGVGKTHLAIALGMIAAGHRKSVYFITCHNLISKLNRAHNENRLDKQLQHLAQYKVLIIDEVGYLPIDHQGSNLFFQLITKIYMNKSTIITTNMAFSKWGEVFSDMTLAAAVLDRLLHYSHIIRITGNSYRIKDKIVESDSQTNKYNE